MYDPVKDGRIKNSGEVSYAESKPPKELEGIVHCYWQIKTAKPLESDFVLHAIPDACVNILFNQQDTDIAGITALQTTYTELNLGKYFDYAGIQLFPGAWKGDRKDTKDSFVGSKYLGDLPLIETNQLTAQLDFSDKQPIFTGLILNLIAGKVIQKNTAILKILSNLEVIHTVGDMAEIANLSPRQLQRILKASTGFSPHDFLKVMRLQQSLKQHHFDRYADQSHFIHSFKKITGYTPTDYFRKYDV